jgi:putative transposase
LSENTKVRDLIRNCADIFATQAQNLEACTLEQFQIDLIEGFAIPTATPYRSSISDDEFIEQVIKELLEAGLVIPSKSEFASPVVVATAPGRAPRFCVDYRILNKTTKGDSYPLPSVESVLRDLAVYSYYCCFDLKSGYWQVPIRKQDRHETVFVCKMGLFEWTVMPFGLKNAPACFQRITDFISNQINASQIDIKCESKEKKLLR